MADVKIVLDEQKVYDAIQDADGTPSMLEAISGRIAANANAMSAGYRTGRFYDRSTHKLKGDTQPSFAWNVQRRGRSEVGLVYTANYAAQKFNTEQNALLKAIN